MALRAWYPRNRVRASRCFLSFAGKIAPQNTDDQKNFTGGGLRWHAWPTLLSDSIGALARSLCGCGQQLWTRLPVNGIFLLRARLWSLWREPDRKTAVRFR